MKNMGKNDILKLILCIIICQALGSSGSVFTNMSVKTWYPTLVKPWFAPPDGLIPVVWIILFTLMGISLFLVWREGLDRPEVKAAIMKWMYPPLADANYQWLFDGRQKAVAGNCLKAGWHQEWEVAMQLMIEDEMLLKGTMTPSDVVTAMRTSWDDLRSQYVPE